MPLQIYVIGCSQTRTDILDGGSRIFIECARRWSGLGHKIQVFTSEEGYKIFLKYGLLKLSYTVLPPSKHKHLGVYLLYLTRTLSLSTILLKFRPKGENVIVYSGSDFWPDSLPAWVLKMRFPKIKWVAGFYLFAAQPFTNASPYKGRRRLRGLLYYAAQLPVLYLIKKHSDMVWVTNESDRWRFIGNEKLTPEKVVAIRGGVDCKTPTLVLEPKRKEFDAVFVGRFHPQKGVLELVDIWKRVIQKKKDAKLAMIGVGELEGKVKMEINEGRLENNITLFGFKDGIEKIQIFKDSRIVLHPAIYDSGGMAACEAMACGLPGVSFDLPALKTYYPKGMLKTPCFDLEAFANNILKLLNNEGLYKITAKDALDWAKEWDWDKRADEFLTAIKRA